MFLRLLLLFGVLLIDETFTSERIIGGSNAGNHEFPYQASIRRLQSHICGASVIHERFLLTAAHCLFLQHLDELTVVLGSNELNNGGDTYYPEKFFINRFYNHTYKTNDVGLIKLNKTINFTKNVQKVKMATQNPPTGVECVLTGWGYNTTLGPVFNKLQKINMVTISLTECQNSYKIKNETQPNSGDLCTFNKKGQGACFGDSGGPLVNIATKQQIGIVSHGEPCGLGQPDVYTNVYKYLNWIGEKILLP